MIGNLFMVATIVEIMLSVLSAVIKHFPWADLCVEMYQDLVGLCAAGTASLHEYRNSLTYKQTIKTSPWSPCLNLTLHFIHVTVSLLYFIFSIPDVKFWFHPNDTTWKLTTWIQEFIRLSRTCKKRNCQSNTDDLCSNIIVSIVIKHINM